MFRLKCVILLCGLIFSCARKNSSATQNAGEIAVSDSKKGGDILLPTQMWHQTDKCDCVVFGYGYNDEAFTTEMKSMLFEKFGDVSDGGYISEVEKQSKRVQELIQCICSESLSETFQQLTDERIEKAGTDIEELEKIKEEARLAFEVEQFLDSLDNSEEMQQRLEDVYRVRDFDALRELVREAKRNKAKKSNGEEWREKNLAALNRILSG